MDKVLARYDIDTDAVMFEGGEPFDVAAVAAAQTPWWNRTLCAVNDAVVRLGVLEGDFHWHKHDPEDEEELVGVVVLVPVEVAFDHTEPDDAAVDVGQRLVEPRRVRRGLGGEVDQRELPVLVVQVDVVTLFAHRSSPSWALPPASALEPAGGPASLAGEAPPASISP